MKMRNYIEGSSAARVAKMHWFFMRLLPFGNANSRVYASRSTLGMYAQAGSDSNRSPM
jgi:hypothetical protein